MIIKGLVGQIAVGYQRAGEFASWEASPLSDNEMDFSGRLRSVDDYWITQDPKELRLKVGRIMWVWRDVAIARRGESVSATLVGKPAVEPA